MYFTRYFIFYLYYYKNEAKYITKISLTRIIILFYNIYYYNFGFYPGTIMLIYFELLLFISKNIKLNNKKTVILFTLSWILQFIGHYIEGKKPALIDSIGQAFLGAPIFSLVSILPKLKNYLNY